MFSTSCKYAIRSTLFLANYSDKDKKIGVKEIAEALQLPKAYLAKILQELTKRNLVSSVKGRNGGFFLSEQDRQHTLEDIVEAIDGKGSFSECILGLAVCSSESPCPLHTKSKEHREGSQLLFNMNSIDEISNNLIEE